MESVLRSRYWTVLCDFDGTIALDDVTDSLLLRFGRPGWETLEADWLSGRIGSRECMQGQVALLDCSPAEMQAHLAAVQIDPQFPAFVAALEARGWPLTIVSDGLDVAIADILRRHGLGRLKVVANQLVADGSRRWRLEFPHARPDCLSGGGNCKCAFAGVMPGPGLPRSQLLMIGDGVSDFCVAKRADLVLARKRLLAHCQDHGLAHHAVPDFRHALAMLEVLDAQLLPTTMIANESESHDR